MVSWAHRLIAEKITVVKADGNQLFPLPDYHDAINDDEPPPKSVGSTWETHGQLSYIMSKVISLLQDLKDLMVFEFNNENVDNARLFYMKLWSISASTLNQSMMMLAIKHLSHTLKRRKAFQFKTRLPSFSLK